MICSATGMEKNDVAVVGDRLYTDIAIGKRSGVTAILVLTGETKEKDLSGLDSTAMPDIILSDAEALENRIFGE